MKNENKIYVFFSAMAGLMTNYFFVAALYQKSGIIEAYSPLRAVIWGNTIVWAIIACLCYKNIIRRDRIRNILFSLSFIQMLFILTVCVDRFVGFLIRSQTPSTMHDKHGLIFDADISARYKTNEIDFEVKTNSLGLRNEEIATTRSGNTRIVCLGDSWTMGWGVNLEQSWPKVMERYLIEQGYSTEVVNCGQGGQYTTTYKKTMERVLPILKPAIAVVGVLQADDLAQLYENHYSLPYKQENAGNSFGGQTAVFISTVVRESYTNIIALRRRGGASVPIDIHQAWSNQAHAMLSSYSRLQAVRYETFDDTVKTMFEGGDLNASLVNYYMFFPERMLVFNDPDCKATRFAVELMKRDVAEMKQLCDRNGCKLVFVNLPNNYFTGHKVVRNPVTDSLFEDYLYAHNHIDSIYRDVAKFSNTAYLEMTDIFKKLQPKDKYFYIYDGHPTAAGYEAIGRTVGQYLIENYGPLEKKE